MSDATTEHANGALYENELAARWKRLLLAESRLQAQRAELENIVDETNVHVPEVPGAEPLDVRSLTVGVAATKLALNEAIAKVLADHVSRPSPDYRALLLNTRRALEKIGLEHVSPVAHAAYREAMRLTDVERLAPWEGTVQGIAMRAILGELAYEIQGYAHAEDDDGTWRAATLRDLNDVHDDPESYMRRLAERRRASTR